MRVIFVIYAQKRNILCIYIILLHIYVHPLPDRAALNMHDMQAALPLFRRSFRLFGPASIRKARAGFGPKHFDFSLFVCYGFNAIEKNRSFFAPDLRKQRV